MSKILCGSSKCIHNSIDGVCTRSEGISLADRICGSYEEKMFEKFENTVVIPDNDGVPSIMVRIPKFKYSDIIEGGADKTVSAFIINGKEVDEIFISKYQNVVMNGKAYSLPMQAPEVNIDFSTAVKACQNKGKGWHLMTNAEWAAIALWCKKNGTLPHGNSNYGKDYYHNDEVGIKIDDTSKTYTGSGPRTWSHDWTEDGIYDLNGNVLEWVSGIKIIDGKLLVIKDNDAAIHPDEGYESITLKSGKEVHFNADGEDLAYSHDRTDDTYEGCRFRDLKASFEEVEQLQKLALFPMGDEPEDMTDYVWADCDGERYCYRGGSYVSGDLSGVFYFHGNFGRSYSSLDLGFRSAFVNL